METAPLLSDSERELLQPKDVYDRFSSAQKRVIVAVISLAGLIPPFASGSFVPCVPEVAKDLNTTGTIINYTVGMFLFMLAVGTLVWAPYAGFYGRQPVYLASLPLLCIGSLGAALSTSVPQLVASRAVQAFGASSSVSVGPATISDIYRLEERGTAMGIFFGTSFIGPALAPLTGGLVATYASWRMMQLILFAMALTALVCVISFLPETSHPGARGMDKLLNQEEIDRHGSSMRDCARRWVWLNPFEPLKMLRGPNILLVALAGGFTSATDSVLLTPMSYTIGSHYGLNNPALIGAFFLPSGVGNMIGSPLAGRLADHAIIKGRQKQGGMWLPEDRLKVTLLGALLLAPFSVLIFGLTTEFIPGRIGIIINVICLFMSGVGVVIVLSPSATYSVDIVHSKSAEIMAVVNGLRNVICAAASVVVLPLINKIGVGATNGLAAVLAWLGFCLLWVTIRYGEMLRAWVDIGYIPSVQNS